MYFRLFVLHEPLTGWKRPSFSHASNVVAPMLFVFFFVLFFFGFVFFFFVLVGGAVYVDVGGHLSVCLSVVYRQQTESRATHRVALLFAYCFLKAAPTRPTALTFPAIRTC